MAKNKNTKKTTSPKTTPPAPAPKAKRAPVFEPIAQRDRDVVTRTAATMARFAANFEAGDGDAIRQDFAAIQRMAQDVRRVVYIARRAGRRMSDADAPSASENESLPEEDPDKTAEE